MSDQQTTKKVVCGILQFLDDELKKTTTSAEQKESLEVAIQCLETAYSVRACDSEYRPKLELRDLVRNLDHQDGGGGDAASVVSSGGSAPPPEGGGPLAGTVYVNTGPEYLKPDEASDSDKKLADEWKNKGNEVMLRLLFLEGLECYNKAIALDGNNPVYFCNRAAAFIKMERYEEARRDCQIAVQLDPSYAKAYGRMGLTYSSQNNQVDAILCYRKARELDPENESYRKNLQVAQHLMIQDIPSAQAQVSASPNLETFLSNPNLANMASQMLQDPTVQNLLQTLMGRSQGGSPGGAPGAPTGGGGGGGLDSLIQIGQTIAQRLGTTDPNLISQLTGALGGGGGGGTDTGAQQSNNLPKNDNDKASGDDSSI
ncbi:unnamed protein product [Orchesella dallaii]|uniref:SGTA homodimerisation domain-containing protein n=1 Tax=Orchesella dallaii TaxID=48710 RepID=A0ABP1PHZ8_9HEXA